MSSYCRTFCVSAGTGVSLTITKSMFIDLRESHCVDTCVVAQLAAPLQEALRYMFVCLGECQYTVVALLFITVNITVSQP